MPNMWANTCNAASMKKISTKEKIRRFLRGRVGRIVTNKEIDDATSGATEWARRLRELRSDEGWKIKSHVDRADLKPGQYILEEEPPTAEDYKFVRQMSARLRAQVLERNGYTCMMCGIGAGEKDATGRKAVLHVGHIVDKSHGGKDELSNLRALCSQCNQGAKNVAQEPPSYTWLLAQIRRASIADQRTALNWLKKKFREE